MEPVEQVKLRLERMLPEQRVAHSYGVADEAVRLAERYGADPEKAYYAGLCHDLCKNMPPEEQLQWIKRSGIILDNAFFHEPPIWHGFAAAQYIREEMDVQEEEILQAVRYHTTGRAGMHLLEKIVFVADLTEPGRAYPDVDTVRTLADRSLEQAIGYILRYTLGKLLVNGGAICRDCWAAYNQLVLERNGQAAEKGVME